LDALKVSCPHCLQPVPRSELNEHIPRCLILCTCGEKVSKIRLSKHLGVCPKQVVKCGAADVGCDWESQRSELHLHESLCHYFQLRSTLQNLMPKELLHHFTLDSDLSGQDLTKFSSNYWTNFSNRVLRGAKFKGACLKGVDFSHSDLKHANFEYCDLTGANFGFADLLGANFSHAKLQSVSFYHAKLSQSKFVGVEFDHIKSCGFINSFVAPHTVKKEVVEIIQQDKVRCIYCFQLKSSSDSNKGITCRALIAQCKVCALKMRSGCKSCNQCSKCKCLCQNLPHHSFESF